MADKLTDNEIIKALGCCAVVPAGGCDKAKCPMIVECLIDRKALEKHALLLINRQKAEIENMDRDIRWYKSLFSRDVVVMRKGAGKTAKVEVTFKIIVKQIRAEAVKEFADRLKANTCEFGAAKGIQREVDNLVKEMVGDG